MIKIALKIGAFFLNAAIFLVLSVVIFRIVWVYLGLEYVYGKDPIGGDYFNALSYQIHFSKFVPNPASGWLSFINGGAPIISGYPFLAFYLINPLTGIYDIATAMNIFSIISLVLFFTASLLLFRQVAKNWFIALSSTSLLFATRATYNQLTTGGFIISASAQWFLPATLLFIYLFAQYKNLRLLILASLSAGLALTYHSATSLLMILLPSTLVLTFLPNLGRWTKRISYLLTFIVLASTTGLMGIYSLYLQNFQGAGTDKCTSPQCWGIYPGHLITWLSPSSPILLIALILVVIVLKLLRLKVSLYSVVPPLAGLLIFIAYAAAAHLHLIDGAANVMPPSRIFWAGNFFILLAAATLFGSIQKSSWFIAYPLSAIVAALSLFYVYSHQPDIHKYVPNTVPKDAANYTPTRYQTKQLSEIVPAWVPLYEPNWRVDIINQGVTHWWNVVATTPQIRGYSNHPLGVHRDWQYFLQASTRSPDEKTDKELVTNRALFLIDAYGIKFIENSLANYTQEITENPNLIVNKDIDFLVGTTRLLKNLAWYQLSGDITSPIVSPTTSPAVLFIGDDRGYEYFIRSIAMTNLNSRFLIPIKGPKSIKDINDIELQNFPALVLYQYIGKDYEKLAKYVKGGGNLYIETNANHSLFEGKLPEIFPADSLTTRQSTDRDNVQKRENDITSDIDTQNFSRFTFEGGPWSLVTTKNIRSWASAYLLYNGQPVISGGKLGAGTVVWSGLNLPFHIIDNNNLEEAQFFKNILSQLVKPQYRAPDFKLEREKPELIKVKANSISGIYFKENYDSGWGAKIDDQKLMVYKAGLEFMYIPVPYTDQNTAIDITYGGNAITWGLYYLTLASLASLVVAIAVPQLPNYIYKKIEAQVKNKVGKKLSTWVDEE